MRQCKPYSGRGNHEGPRRLLQARSHAEKMQRSQRRSQPTADSSSVCPSECCLATDRERLQELDVSFCRSVNDDALGLVADSCPGLRRMHLWGCTQASNAFLNGHGNDNLVIIGRGEALCAA